MDSPNEKILLTMLEKQFDAIDRTDILALVESKKAERRTLEYKAELPLGGDDAKREFLSDIASFANSAGGDILYGVTDERDENGQPTGIPLEASGLPGVNETAEQLRLENIIRDGIAPRITGIQVKAVAGFAKGPVIVLRVPRSWVAPHMVTFKNLSRFYGRNSAGKYQLDLGEIKSAFVLSESFPDKIRAFRAERLAKIISTETPIPFASNRAVVLHLLPITAIEGKSGADVSREGLRHAINLAPLMANSWAHRFNADGFLTYDDKEWGFPQRRAATYVQVFRSGVLEIANQRILIRAIPEHDEVIPMGAFEEQMIKAAQHFSRFQRNIGISPPVVVMLSLVGVRNFSLTVNSQQITHSKIDRDVLMAPDVLIEDFNFQADVLLKPALDFIWQAAGLADSPNYGQDGRWKER